MKNNKIKEEEIVRKLKDSFPDMLDFNNNLKELREFWKQQATADFITDKIKFLKMLLKYKNSNLRGFPIMDLWIEIKEEIKRLSKLTGEIK